MVRWLLALKKLALFPKNILNFMMSSNSLSSVKMVNIESNNSINLSNVTAFRQPTFFQLQNLFKKHGYEIRVAGGAVRDVLMSIDPKDIDLATTATPSEMIDMFNKEEIRMLNRNGEVHGTVTVRLQDKENYEITTLRIDVNPNGRHTDVSFTTDWKVDASRRDLTVNSMFIAVHCESVDIQGDNFDQSTPIYGTLYDYCNGYEDLSNRKIRFVGDPASRIQEDYLRILRYFRFHGRIAASHENHDAATLKAIKENSVGLKRIAGERVWSEIKQIMHYHSAPSLLRHMLENDVAIFCGLPQKINFPELETVYKRGVLKLAPNSATCLAAAFNTQEEIDVFCARVHPSTFEATTLAFIVYFRQNCPPTDELLDFFKRELLLSTESGRLKPIFEEMLRYLGQSELLSSWFDWTPPRFPTNGHRVTMEWGVKGKMIRQILYGLKKAWVDSDCLLDEEQLLCDEMKQKLTNNCPVERPSLLSAKRPKLK